MAALEQTRDNLSELEERVLAFERTWWRLAGAKETAILREFDLPATRYYQVLNQLLDNEQALRTDPLLVKRLRRQRDSRQRQRSDRRVATAGR